MRAIVYDELSSPAVLELQEVDKPSPRAMRHWCYLTSRSLGSRRAHVIAGTPSSVCTQDGLSKTRTHAPRGVWWGEHRGPTTSQHNRRSAVRPANHVPIVEGARQC
jgi:hypothetical protein